MRTNIVIDDNLMQAALEATGLDTKRAVVEATLKLVVRLKAQERIRDLRGRAPWEGDREESRRDRPVDAYTGGWSSSTPTSGSMTSGVPRRSQGRPRIDG